MYETRYTSRHAVCTLGKFVPPCIGLTLNSCNGLLENVHLVRSLWGTFDSMLLWTCQSNHTLNPKIKKKLKVKKKQEKFFSILLLI